MDASRLPERLALLFLAAALARPAVAAAPATPAAGAPAPLAGEQRSLYAAGLMLAGSLDVFGLTDAELATVLHGLRDGVAGTPAFGVDEETRGAVQALARKRLAARAEEARAVGQALRAKAAEAPGAVKTATGLVYLARAEGTGAQPTAADAVKVRYTGRLADGKVFDGTEPGGAAASFRLEQVTPCWAEGLQRMKAGGRARLVCPPELAYGDRGVPGEIPGGATLDFEIELVAVEPAAR